MPTFLSIVDETDEDEREDCKKMVGVIMRVWEATEHKCCRDQQKDSQDKRKLINQTNKRSTRNILLDQLLSLLKFQS